LRLDGQGTGAGFLDHVVGAALGLGQVLSGPASAAARPAAIFFSRSFIAPRMIGQMKFRSRPR
jgi:hypothetical protein